MIYFYLFIYLTERGTCQYFYFGYLHIWQIFSDSVKLIYLKTKLIYLKKTPWNLELVLKAFFKI